MNNLMKKKNGVIGIVIPAIEWLMAIFSIAYTFYRGFDGLPNTWIFNVSADLICIFINLFLITGILIGAETIDIKYQEFLLICHANFLSLFMDFASWMMDGVIGSRWLLLFINTSLYISNLCLTAFYARFITDTIVSEKKRKKYYYVIYILLAITIITRLFNIKYGYFFTISESGVYSRGSYQYLSYVYTIFIQVLVIILLIKSNVNKEQKNAIIAFCALPFISSIVSIFIYGLSLMYACVLISIVMIYSAFFVELEEDKGKIIENFEKYISNDIVQKIIDNPSSKLIEGRKYNTTILISDIRGFTALSETMKPKDLVDMLNHYYGVISDIIYEAGGVVIEFLGDGIMCVFGAPKEKEDHADSAIWAALKIQNASKEINAWNKEHNYPSIKTGIGINTGNVILGSIGNEKHAKYSAVGQTVDRTFEIESFSIGGQVLISSSVLRAVKGEVDSRFLIDYIPDPNELVKIKIYEVNSIKGSYNIIREKTGNNTKKLEKEIETTFNILSGKHVNNEEHKCMIIEMSDTSCIIETNIELHMLDNIYLKLEHNRSIYGKVEEINERKAHIFFI